MWWPAWAVTVGGFTLYVVFTMSRWRRMVVPSYDLAIFEQTVKAYAHFQPPYIYVKGDGFIQLGDHFSPLLALLAPFYRLWPGPITLLVAQCALVALSILPLTVTAKRHLGPAAAVLLGCAYALAWGFQSGLSVDFHEYALAVPILAFVLTALMAERWLAAAVWAGLLLGVKEDLGFTTAAIGLIMAVQGWRRRRAATRPPARAVRGEGDVVYRPPTPPDPGAGAALADARRQFKIGAVTAAAGLVGALLTLLAIVPAFNPGGRWEYWSRLADGGGASDADSVTAALERLPDLVLTFFTTPAKIDTLVLLAGLTAGAGAVSWLALAAAPTLLWHFMSPIEGLWGTSWHNSLILMPMAFAAGLDGLRKLKGSASPAVRRYVRAAPTLALAFALVVTSQFPFRELTERGAFSTPRRAAEAAAVVHLIDQDATVVSDVGLITRLAANSTVYWIGSPPVRPADYVVFDPVAGGWNMDPGDPATWGEGRWPDTDYEIVYGEQQSGDPSAYRVARRVG
jgi:uncharacterized membrane protein